MKKKKKSFKDRFDISLFEITLKVSLNYEKKNSFKDRFDISLFAKQIPR